MPFKLVTYSKNEEVIIVPKDRKTASVPVYEPYKDAECIHTDGAYKLFQDFCKGLGITIITNTTRHNDRFVWLYPKATLDNCRNALARYAPMYVQPQVKLPNGLKYPNGSDMYFEAYDCDNKSNEWLRAMYHWALPGQCMFSFIGYSDITQYVHAYAYALSKEKDFIALNGDVVLSKVRTISFLIVG